jgi:peptidoglycan/xylan/chitin deacetylase (PgdA/CDA1 family)
LVSFPRAQIRIELQASPISYNANVIFLAGKFPSYVRVPYLSHGGSVLQVLTDLAYHYAHTDIDTKDYQNKTPETIETSVTRFEEGLDAGGSLVLAHDIHQTTAKVLVPRMIEILQKRGLRGESHKPLYNSRSSC